MGWGCSPPMAALGAVDLGAGGGGGRGLVVAGRRFRGKGGHGTAWWG